MTGNLVIAVDAKERSLDPLALVSVFPYDPLADPGGVELTRVRDEARDILLELAEELDVEVADARVIASNFAARELQHVTEEDATAVIVVGSTGRGPVGRLLPGGVGERLFAGSGRPVAMDPRGYAERPAERLERIGVAFDDSQESHRALAAGLSLARSSGAQLRVISVFHGMPFGTIATLGTHGVSANDLLRAELHRALDEAVAALDEEVPVEGRFLDGSPGEVLARESVELDLLLAGSRGYGPRAAVLLGSTTQALSRTALCPGLVLPGGWG